MSKNTTTKKTAAKTAKTAKTTTEKPIDGNWTFAANVMQHTPTQATLIRKVKTRKVISLPIGFVNEEDIIGNLRKGFEVRLTMFGKEAIRLFPVLAADFKSVYVCAQSMGSFRTSTYTANKVELYSKRKAISDDEVEKMKSAAVARNEAWKKNMIEVTPDTVLTCPTCGTLLRIGRASRPPTLEAA